MGDSLTFEEMKSILMQDPHMVEVRPGEEWSIPDIDLSLWDSSDKQSAERSVKAMSRYLTSPYLIDNFETDHGSRRRWESALCSKNPGLREYFNMNSLGINNLSTFLNDMIRGIREGYIGTDVKGLDRKIIYVTKSRVYTLQYTNRSTAMKAENASLAKRRGYDILVFLSMQKRV